MGGRPGVCDALSDGVRGGGRGRGGWDLIEALLWGGGGDCSFVGEGGMSVPLLQIANAALVTAWERDTSPQVWRRACRTA